MRRTPMLALKKALLPVDFSGRCAGAARYLHALAARFGTEVTLLHVIPPPHYEFTSVEVGGAVLDDLIANRTSQLREELERYLGAELQGVGTHRMILDGDPARRIVEYAHREKIDLIMMPTHGYGPFRRFILGSVTAKVLHDADCPIWTGVHLEQAPNFDQISFRTIVAALDLGEQSCRTLRWAAGLAEAYGSRLVIAHATASIEGRAGEYFDPNWREHLAAAASEAIDKLSCGIPVATDRVIESGDAPKVICGAAEKLKADLLVIGRGSAAGVFGRLRQNAYSIIRQSPCPVVSV
ncbi:MAG: universal stress protein [Bryobacteraceae bacterium]|nr:universal stress protein [Bryobacteraceae bacterium]